MGEPAVDVDEVPTRTGIGRTLLLTAVGLVIVVAAGALTLGSLDDDHDEADGPAPSQAQLTEALELCARHAGATRQGVRLNHSVPTTAGAVTRAAKAFTGSTLAPWDSLAPGHYVARCSYAQLEDDRTPTTVCPDGEVHSTAMPEQLLVDRDGRVTADIEVPRPPACPG